MEVSRLGLDTEHWEVSVCCNYQLPLELLYQGVLKPFKSVTPGCSWPGRAGGVEPGASRAVFPLPPAGWHKCTHLYLAFPRSAAWHSCMENVTASLGFYVLLLVAFYKHPFSYLFLPRHLLRRLGQSRPHCGEVWRCAHSCHQPQDFISFHPVSILALLRF